MLTLLGTLHVASLIGSTIRSTPHRDRTGSTDRKIGPDLHLKGRDMDKTPAVMGLGRVAIGGTALVVTGHRSRDDMRTLVIGQGRHLPMATEPTHRIRIHEVDRSTEINTGQIVDDIGRLHHRHTIVVVSPMASLGVHLQVGASHIENRLVSANQLLKMWLETLRKGMMSVRVVRDIRRQVDLATLQMTMWILT